MHEVQIYIKNINKQKKLHLSRGVSSLKWGRGCKNITAHVADCFGLAAEAKPRGLTSL